MRIQNHKMQKKEISQIQINKIVPIIAIIQIKQQILLSKKRMNKQLIIIQTKMRKRKKVQMINQMILKILK